MRSKKFELQIAGKQAIIEADLEGECRYMVRMHIPGILARVRIGYLTGSKRQWLGEFFGGRQSVPASTAKDACSALAEAAIKERSLSGFLATGAK